jgi:hypothetical protein
MINAAWSHAQQAAFFAIQPPRAIIESVGADGARPRVSPLLTNQPLAQDETITWQKIDKEGHA